MRGASVDLEPPAAKPTPFYPWLRALSAFLHAGGTRGAEWRRLPEYAPPLIVVLCGCAYGAVMAGYHGFGGDRLQMVLYGALKVPLLFLATMVLAVPCFYVTNLLLGVGDDFEAVWRGLTDYQLLVALQLAALAPVTVFVNLSNGDYRTAQAWSALMFAVAAWNARRALRACYRPLIARHPAHRLLSRVWFVLYAFVGIQMGWDLRPFVGHPTMPVQFLRDDIGNAYVETAHILRLYVEQLLSTL
ncbi:MAG: hypothetical protein NTW87_35545 [Planctomycetota bacterium]|nr:hypothetical protein [Planctomycetota bacterium]